MRGGARWSIGTRSSLPILDERWLKESRYTNGSIQGAHFVQGFRFVTVIEDDTKHWNSTLIQQICSAEIPSKILSTSLDD